MKGGFNYNNKMMLIILAIVATLNVVAYIMYNMTHVVIVFGIIAGLTYMFSDKNMIYTLGVPIVITNALVVLHNKFGIMSGLEGMESMDASGGQLPRRKAAVAAAATKHDIHVPHLEENTDTTTDVEPHTEEAFEGNTKNGRYRVDYASTIEDQYKELSNVLSSDSIKNLTADTHNLMKKQLELQETMKAMGPLVQSMAPLLTQVKGLMSGIKPS